MAFNRKKRRGLPAPRSRNAGMPSEQDQEAMLKGLSDRDVERIMRGGEPRRGLLGRIGDWLRGSGGGGGADEGFIDTGPRSVAAEEPDDAPGQLFTEDVGNAPNFFDAMAAGQVQPQVQVGRRQRPQQPEIMVNDFTQGGSGGGGDMTQADFQRQVLEKMDEIPQRIAEALGV